MLKVSRMDYASARNLSFGRAPRPDEEKDFQETIQKGKDFVGIKNLALILHGSSFPVADNDLFIGSPIGKKAVEVNKFLKMHGFDSIQLGPSGMIKPKNPSPYLSTINSKNYLFTDMEKLTTEPYAKILSKEDIEKEASPKYEKYSSKTDFERAYSAYNELFEKAYTNMMEKVENKDEDAVKLNREFNKYKVKEGEWLKNDALFDFFANPSKYDSDNFLEEWNGDSRKELIDLRKNLITYKNNPKSPRHQDAIKYIENIENDEHKNLEIYKFKQFIIQEKQEKEFIKENPDKLDYISDAIIGFSMKDYWSNQEAFLEGYRIGCPYGGEGEELDKSQWGNNQIWDIPVLDPKRIFKEDGSLDIGGKLLRNKFEKILDSNQNIRIDHVLGLVDPWIYNKNNVEQRYGRYDWESPLTPEHVVYTNAHGANISQMGKPNTHKIENDWWPGRKELYHTINQEIEAMPQLDPDGNYPKIIEKILLPLFEKKGIDKNQVVWEDLCCPTGVFEHVYNNLNLPKISLLLGARAEHEPVKNWFLVGSHDNPPLANIFTDDYYKSRNNCETPLEGSYLVGVNYPELSEDERNEKVKKLDGDKRERVILKFQELFKFGEKIQVSFMDFFGLNKVYNHSGTENSENWKLRLNKNYQEKYYKTLEDTTNADRVALNMPAMLKRAVISTIHSQPKSMEEKYKDIEAAKPLIKKLDYYENMLYEKSDN